MENFQLPSGESFPRLYLKDSESDSMDECIVNYASEHYDISMSLKDPLHPSFRPTKGEKSRASIRLGEGGGVACKNR